MQKIHRHQRLMLFIKCRGQKARERKRFLYRRQLGWDEPCP
jgi:hypothetical protein